MKRISFFLALALIVASFGLANASSISLEPGTPGTWDDGGTIKVIPNATVVFEIRFTSTEAVKNSFTNGFRIYGPSSFDMLVGDTVGFSEADFNFGLFINPAPGNNGSGADTIGVGGVVSSNAGLPPGYDQVGFTITTGNIAEGETLCIDSSFYPPTGAWKWAGTGGDVFPDWDGPHCFLSQTPTCLPPAYSGPLSLSGSHCDLMTHDFGPELALSPINIPVGALELSSDIGSFVGTVWSYQPTLADVGASISVTITAGNTAGNPAGCSGDNVINLTFTNEAPAIACPAGVLDVGNGLDTDVQMSATDDCDGISWSVSGPATIDPNTGLMTLSPTVAGPQTVTVTASDGNASTDCLFEINAIDGAIFQVEIACIGEPAGPVFQGQHVSIPVTLTTANIIDGYDLLIGYDNSALSFQSADPSAELVADGWEYFTYRYGPNGNCSNACPSGMLRLTAIAETNNGPNHPTLDGITELAVLDFLVTNDRLFECQEIPLRFYWMDCGDNTLSADGGNTLIVSSVVFDGDETLFPPNGNEIQDGTVGYPTYFGAQDECIVAIGDKPVPIRDASFNNGCVFIACADAIDARGDINLNNVSNEIADAVLYSNYFVYGLGVFSVNVEGQIAASDVNADGLSLSVADLVYLIRIVVGDALPYPKTALDAVNASVIDNNGVVSVDAEMGAAFVVIKGNVNAELLANNMTIESAFDGVNTRVLVYSLEGNSFSGEFLNANGDIVSIELGSVEGATVNAKLIPANFELAQNYPNPFNPSTTVSFSVPFNSDITLTIYNVTGQKVADFSGTYEAGIHSIEWDASLMASGVYFYKLNAGNFSDTRKMVLLK